MGRIVQFLNARVLLLGPIPGSDAIDRRILVALRRIGLTDAGGAAGWDAGGAQDLRRALGEAESVRDGRNRVRAVGVAADELQGAAGDFCRQELDFALGGQRAVRLARRFLPSALVRIVGEDDQR